MAVRTALLVPALGARSKLRGRRVWLFFVLTELIFLVSYFSFPETVGGCGRQSVCRR
jgi:hypothetical protein